MFGIQFFQKYMYMCYLSNTISGRFLFSPSCNCTRTQQFLGGITGLNTK